MNLNHLSDDELLHYLDKHSTDPLIQRLVNVLMEKQYGLVSDLVAAGMDPQDWTFCTDYYNHYYPGQYITHLKSELDYISDELEGAQFKLTEANREIASLKAMTVAELIKDLHQEAHTANYRANEAEQQRRRAVEEAETAKKKMKVWNAIATD